MPRKKKAPHEMTKDELARLVFPKKVIEEANKVAHEKDEPSKKTENQ